MRHSYSHGSRTGHLVKSRARVNRVEYNVLADDPHDTSSFELQFAEGGEALVLGNLIVQSGATDNATMLSYAAEARRGSVKGSLTLAYNTFVSERSTGAYVSNHSPVTALSIANVYAGVDRPVFRGPVDSAGDSLLTPQAFEDFGAHAFRLRAESAGLARLDSAVLRTLEERGLVPASEPGDGVRTAPRVRTSAGFAGAFEPCPAVGPLQE